MTGSLIFAGKNLNEFGVLVSGVDTYGAPERLVTPEAIPGRNGSVLMDENTYADVEVEYHVAIRGDFASNMRGLRDFLLSTQGYARMEDSYAPEDFYQAAYYAGIELTAEGPRNKWATFDLTFYRKPQRFLKVGEQPIELTASGAVNNPTLFTALPLIRVYGRGIITVNGVGITITGTQSYTDIDCDVQDAYYGAQNLNQYVTLSPNRFPVLSPGSNSVVFGSGITKAIITPHWWHL